MSTQTLSAQAIMGDTRDHLVAVDDQHWLTEPCAQAFSCMQQAAAQCGHDLQICSSFRDFSRQLSIWNRKWCGELPLYTLTGDKLNASDLSDTQKIHAIMLWSALPGASRHHWGTDFDVYDKREVEQRAWKFELVPAEYENDGPCAALAEWLRQNMQHYGFYLPYANYTDGVAQEPWHLSFNSQAQTIEKQFSIDTLAKKLESSDILGKQSILAVLPELVHRYTFNHGTHEP